MIQDLEFVEMKQISGGISELSDGIYFGIGCAYKVLAACIREDPYWYRSFIH